MKFKISRTLFGVSVILGILGGIGLDAWIVAGSQPVIYHAEAHEIELKPALIGVSINWTEERIIEEIKKWFPEEPRMVRVAWCESRYVIDAQGPTDDHGLFQIHAPSHDVEGIDLYDPIENIKFARKLYDESGLRPWLASSKCWTK